MLGKRFIWWNFNICIYQILLLKLLIESNSCNIKNKLILSILKESLLIKKKKKNTRAHTIFSKYKYKIRSLC